MPPQPRVVAALLPGVSEQWVVLLALASAALLFVVPRVCGLWERAFRWLVSAWRVVGLVYVRFVFAHSLAAIWFAAVVVVSASAVMGVDSFCSACS